MTVSVNSNFEMTRDTLIRRAYQVAGVAASNVTISGDDISMAVDFLGAELDSLQAEGVILRTVERTTVALTSGEETYALDSDCIDIAVDPDNFGGMVWATSGSETRVTSVSRQQYEKLSNKTATGTPTMVYFEKQATISAIFWPVPDASMTFRYSKVRLIKDADTGGVTLDLQRKWQKAIMYSLAWQLALAKGMPLDKVGFLRNTADQLKSTARADEAQKGDAQFVLMR